MRIVSVLGVVAVGLVIGTSAVLAPLAIGSAPAGGSVAGWGAGLAARLATSLRERGPLFPQPTPEPPVVAEATLGRPISVSDQASKSLQYLSHIGPVAKAETDAKSVVQPWTTQVTPEPASPRRLTSSKPASEDQRRELVRDIQRELKRVGCFEAEADGQWGTASKRAMASFTDRVNATLPVEEPDLILLTLVQGHKGRACGQGCPSGQGLNEAGRCVPNSILAHSDRTKQADRAKPERVAATPAPDRQEAAGPSVSVGSPWSATTIRAPVETGSVAMLPPSAPAGQSRELSSTSTAPPYGVTVRSAPPLPGRMTVGGPIPAETQSPSVPVTAPPVPADTPPPAEHKAAPREHSQARPKPAPEPVVVRRPPPAPKPYVSQPAPSNASKSRRLVYEMFQRPDRN